MVGVQPTWTISDTPEEPGEQIDLEGWHASFGAGGCLRAGGRVTAEVARRVEQGHELKAYIGGACKWSGPISRPPLVYRGAADLEASGWRQKAERATGRLFYQSRDGGLLYDRSEPPTSSLAPTPDKIGMSIDPSGIVWQENVGAEASGAHRGAVLWVKGTPGGLTNYAFDWQIRLPTSDYEIKVYRFAPPTDAGYTLVAGHPLSTATGSVNQSVSGGQDGLLFQLEWVGAPGAFGGNAVVVGNLRVNGIASGDTFTTSQVVTDILGRLGFDTSGVQSSGMNVLPYDLKEGNWFSALDYMAFLDDRPVVNIVPADDGSRMGIYRPWGENVHTISLENAEPELNSLPLYNGVTVFYPHVGGFQAEVPIRPSDIGEPDPLAGTDSDNFLGISLSDVQPLPDDTLATAHGQAVMARLLNARDEGTFIIPAIPDETLWDIYHGNHVRVSDAAPLEAREFPVDTVTLAQGQPARVGIYSPGSELSIAARFGLEQARLIQNPEIPALDIIEEEIEKKERIRQAAKIKRHITYLKKGGVTKDEGAKIRELRKKLGLGVKARKPDKKKVKPPWA